MFSSLTSRYSIDPSCKKLSNVWTPALKEQKIKSVLKLQLLIKETRHKLDLPTTPSYDVLWSSICPCRQVDDKFDLHQKQRKHGTENIIPLKVSCAVMILYTGKTLQKQDDAEGSNKRHNCLKVSCAVMILHTGKTLQKQNDAEGSSKRHNCHTLS